MDETPTHFGDDAKANMLDQMYIFFIENDLNINHGVMINPISAAGDRHP